MKIEKKVPDPITLNAPNARAAKAAREPQPAGTEANGYGVESCCVRQFWAVVETDGTFVRGRNVLRVQKLPGTVGMYEVFFTGDVSNGVFVATIGRPGIATEPTGQIGVALRCCPGAGMWTPFDDNKGVWVETFDSSGNYSDRAFHLMVLTQ